MFDIKPALFIFQCTCSLATACLFYHIVFSLSRLFLKFFEKVFNFFSTRTLLFPCSLALSTDDLIIIHSIIPFVNTFFQLFSSFFIFLFATLYIVDHFLSYILFPLQKQKNMPAFAGIFNQRYTTLVKIHHTIIIILIELLTYLCLSPIYESAYAINTPPITVANGMYL